MRFLLHVASLLLLAAVLACGSRPEHCWVCQREIHDSVRATLRMTDGKEVHACCPRCALHFQEEAGERVRRIAVTDYASGSRLPMEQAFFVEGSDETPCVRHHPIADEQGAPMHVCFDRCMPSLIAFARDPDARAFVTDHGGTLLPPGSLPPVEAK